MRAPRRSWTEAERAIVLRARLRVSALVALAITGLVALIGGTAYAVLERAQGEQVRRELRHGVEHGPPSGSTWLFTGAGTELGAGTPPRGFPLRDDLARVRADGGEVERTVAANGTEYLVLTRADQGGEVVQAVFDARHQLADRRYLLAALAVGEACALVAAAATGVLVGREAVAPLAEALTRQRRFVADASHELRTPIARARLRAQLLARKAEAEGLPPEHRAGLDRLIGTIGGLGDVVDDLLRSALLTEQSGRAVDLAALARDAVAAEVDRAAERRIALSARLPSGPLVVTGVETALLRAVAELLANAVRHTPPGGRVDVGLARAGGVAELTVADTGEGFDPVAADRLFDRHHRGPGGGEQGFGLGLALVREVVVGHGGAVGAVGAPGRGARFTVRLPLAESAPTGGGAGVRGEPWRAGSPAEPAEPAGAAGVVGGPEGAEDRPGATDAEHRPGTTNAGRRTGTARPENAEHRPGVTGAEHRPGAVRPGGVDPLGQVQAELSRAERHPAWSQEVPSPRHP
ncbi:MULTISPECIES: HAMP domain-containing sensor histidine kinase [Actinosynnema]|uniref:sensor histidine kinase n=1 Tax=Actinosynnema TaxID=40566 RepID=UPI0020A34322|nr:HAMP domain-containing sensor histidine kinase [Actinosynnema pretiosum]MCP2094521.1 two-component system, OmpR family, sensor kinase [Actinosynnema pretiosum]